MAAGFTKSQINLQALESIVGASNVQAWELVDKACQTSIQRAIAPQQAVSAIVFPNTQAELADVVKCAQQNDWVILPCGAGSKLDWGGLVAASVGEDGQPAVDRPLLVVSTERLNRLIEHAIGDLTVTVEAGMRFTDLQNILAQAGQFLALDPTLPEQATIGGVVATADTGSLRQRYNSVRDMLLGLSFVRADGQIAKAGGRVVKNVAGYDLMKLFTGSYGTLGIISQVTFRVYPLPLASQTIILSGAADTIAQATATLLGSALMPAAVDLLSPSLADQLGLGRTMAIGVRFQSIAPSVQEQINRMIEVGQALQLNTSTYAATEEAVLWQQLREAMAPGDPINPITCKIGVRPSEAVAVLKQIETLVPSGLGQIHAASGLGKLVFAAVSLQPEVLLQVRSLCQANSGFLSVLQAPVAFKQQIDVWGYSGNALSLMRGLKQQFDPQNLFSPHRFVGGI